MAGTILYAASWLAAACPAAAPAQPMLALGRDAHAQSQAGAGFPTAVFGMAGHGAAVRRAVLVDRLIDDEQISRTAERGTPGPLYAWREPVTP